MQRPSPPKHRHDGTSPLPLGMDWSPPPRQWNGRDTVWPHDSRTGWSYCVTLPSWVVLPKSRDSDPVVFYRVNVGVQSPEGVTTTRGVLRRFNDFMKLFTDLKNMFPKKSLPSTPPKGLLRLKSRTLLEERRRTLEEWMVKLLSDINISRSIIVASFLELEAAARSSFQDVNPQASEADSQGSPSQSNLPTIVGSSSMVSDYGSDTAYEISEAGRDDNSEIGLDDLKLDDPIEKLVKYGMTNIDEGLFMGQTILDQLEGLPRNKGHSRHFNNINGNESKPSSTTADGLDLFSDAEISKVIAHARKLSDESEGSDVSSLRGSELSNQGFPNFSGDGSEQHTSGFPQLLLPLDQRNKMNRLLQTMQRRLITAKTDMEDLIARFNQETAVKDYLATKVKDLEVELETDRQKSIENLQQALLVERERCTKVQWDMEELRQKSLEMELKLKSKSEKEKNTSTESTSKSQPADDRVELLRQLDSSKQQLEILTKQYEEREAKSKADRKVLVKEVKHLRSSHAKLENELSKSLQEKSEAEMLLKQEREKSEQVEIAKKTLLQKCKILRDRIHECNLGLSSSSPEDALNLLTISDDQISLLLKEAELINQENGASVSDPNEYHETIINKATDEELGKAIANIITDEVRLRKRVNSVLHRHKETDIETSSPVKDKSS